jgi:hypothetical protein
LGHESGGYRSGPRRPVSWKCYLGEIYGAAFHLAHQFPGMAIGERMINDRMQAIRRLLPLQKACHG